MITQDFLKALTTYNENDGFFYDYSGNRFCQQKDMSPVMIMVTASDQ